MNSQAEKILDKINDLYLGYSGNYLHEIDIIDIYLYEVDFDLSIFDDFDSLSYYLDDAQAFHYDTIGYYDAINYLMEEDASLNRSLSLAKEYGYKIDRIDSELLASILISEKRVELWQSFKPQIETILNKYKSN